MSKNGVDLANQAAGGPTKLAEALGITQAAVSQWERVPIQHVLKIEELYKIDRHDLRPDIYPERLRIPARFAGTA